MAQENACSSKTTPTPIPQQAIEIKIQPTHFHAWFSRMESNVERASVNCIPKVPSILRDREFNKKCFDPMMVSLGPYHHGKPHLHRMEMHKFEALKRFSENSVKADSFYQQFEPEALEAKKWYEKSVDMSDEEFKIMMFMDCCFILNSIDEMEAKQKPREQTNTSNAPVNNYKPLLNTHDDILVVRDMMMLENQIPFFLLDKLKSIKQGSNVSCNLDYFTSFVNNVIGSTRSNSTPNVMITITPIHLLDLFRKKMLNPEKTTSTATTNPLEPQQSFFTQSVTELKQAGIRCRKGEMMHLNEAKFDTSIYGGVLSLPHIVIDDMSKFLFLNMIAYEMGGGGPSDTGIVSYICLMDALIDGEEDVKELRARGILDNALSTDKELADLFNRLAVDLIWDSDAYDDIQSAIANYRKSGRAKCSVHLQEFLQTYFKSPWTLISLVAAVFLLFLTAVQTYKTVFP